MRHRTTIPSLILLMTVIAACGAGVEATATPQDAGDKEPVMGEATIDNIEILILESFPVQVHVVARGTVPDGCTTIAEIQQMQAGTTFLITITTIRPASQACTQALVPFEETIPLEVYGLRAGTYRVEVNSVTDSFELSVDNVIQEEGTPYP